jgi:carboxyl-terminal processing protease
MNKTKRHLLSAALYLLIACMAWPGCSISKPRPEEQTKPVLSSLDAQYPLNPKDYIRELTPTKGQALTSMDIIRKLSKRHYQRMAVDDKLSAKVLKRYLSDLDRNRTYFLSSDIKEFQAYRHELDDALMAGDLKPAFRIFNRCQKRVIERLVSEINRIESGLLSRMNFDLVEVIQADREKAPWASDMTQLDDFWRKRIKNRVLIQKLSGKTLKEIRKSLLRRYRSRLNRTTQTHTEDAFRVYMNAVAKTYDPHTQYFSPLMSENFNIQMSLSLEGIGAVLQTEDEYTKILRLVPAGPAEKSKKLGPGDRIVSVGQGASGDMIDIIGWRIDDVVNLIRGPKGTVVRLKIIPAAAQDEHQTKIVSITRDKVKLEEQSAKKKVIEMSRDGRAYKIGILEIPTFYVDFKALHSGALTYKSTSRDTRKLLKELTRQNVDGIIIDLRDNSGGALREANTLTGLFIETGPTVLIRESNGRTTQLNDKDPEIAYDGPLVVMVNRLSASASEIFAGALQDYHRAVVVGAQTFGKGTVQSLLAVRQGQLKLTSAKFYRISGESTQHRGIIPDINFPAVYDPKKIGESALPQALPWDKIRPAEYKAHTSMSRWISQLRAQHQARIRNSADFKYLYNNIQRLKEKGKKTEFTLHEATRKLARDRMERERLDLVNKRRTAKGLKPVKTISELEKLEEPDALLSETQNILLDLILLSRNRTANR